MKLYNVYTYAFLKTPTEELKLPVGIAGQVFLMTWGDLSALVEPEVCLETLQNDDERLIQAVLSHDRVICELFQQTTVLPLRFGTSFLETENLLAHLDFRGKEYREKLQKLQGKGEYILRFIPRNLEEPVLPSEVRGRQYFLAKKQHYETLQDYYILQTAEWQNAVHLVTEVYRATIIIASPGAESRIYLLVPCQQEDLLELNVLHWQTSCPRWQLQLGKASPPYHFI